MATSAKTLIELETKFWQSMIDQDADAALQLLHDPSQMASSHGAMRFDHSAYRKMAEQGTTVVMSFELSHVEVVFPTETTAVLTYQLMLRTHPQGQRATWSLGLKVLSVIPAQAYMR